MKISPRVLGEQGENRTSASNWSPVPSKQSTRVRLVCSGGMIAGSDVGAGPALRPSSLEGISFNVGLLELSLTTVAVEAVEGYG